MRVLGIESSCDETGVAIYDSQQGLMAEQLHSQIALHQQYGGVVPELASRDHIRHLVSLLDNALKEAQCSIHDIDAIAYTKGPGLIGALLTGSAFAKSLAFALSCPVIGVHHLEAHILAAKLETPSLAFPFLALLVSGGHTELVLAKALGDYECLGQTVDDAVGEAFDKTAKVMGLPYPGGAILAGYADRCPAHLKNLPPFPRPMLDRPGLDFSFSGLKTHALHAWQNSTQDEAARHQIAYAFQEAVVETLLKKCARALETVAVDTLIVAGGVGANQALRQRFKRTFEAQQIKIMYPKPAFCTDNGAMIAYAGYLHLTNGERDPHLAIEVQARSPL